MYMPNHPTNNKKDGGVYVSVSTYSSSSSLHPIFCLLLSRHRQIAFSKPLLLPTYYRMPPAMPWPSPSPAPPSLFILPRHTRGSYLRALATARRVVALVLYVDAVGGLMGYDEGIRIGDVIGPWFTGED